MSCKERNRRDLSAAVRGGDGSARRQWRSLDELAGTPQFHAMLEDEFPHAATEWTDEPSRRNFLKLMAASLALAGVYGCTERPTEAIVPYVMPPEQVIPGRALYFATATNWNGYARGVLVESHEGRPTKIEGNPDHPASLGATDGITQAEILNLYDPDRSKTILRNGDGVDWNSFIEAITVNLAPHQASGGQGVRLLTGTITSPTLADQIRRFLKQYPGARWHQWEPVNFDNERTGTRQALGQDAQAVFRFDKADVIVSLDDNFLLERPGSLAYARQFINGRRVRRDNRRMNRLYVAEATPTITGAMADQRLRIRPSRIEPIARALFTAISGGGGGGGGAGATSQQAGLDATETKFVAMVAGDLAAHRGASLVTAGESQPPAVHALAHAINSQLGNLGKTVVFIDPVEAEPVNQLDSLRSLVADMNAGGVTTLIILGGNPVYTAPADLDFAAAMHKVALRVHLASHYDETSFLCHWHLPMSHTLEAWSDLRAFDGTTTIVQPLIAPLYGTRSAHELLAILTASHHAESGYEVIRNYWREHHGAGDFDAWWQKTLNDGLVAGSASVPKKVTVNVRAATSQPAAGRTSQPANGIEIVFRPDPQVWDGRHANNGWLMEMPRPLHKLSWDNAALMSENTARAKGLINTEKGPGNTIEASVVEIHVNGRTVRAPAWVLPGQPDDVVTLHLGFGRTRAGSVGNGAGFNAYAIRTTDALWSATAVREDVKKTEDVMPLACTQNHHAMEQHERDLVHVYRIGDPVPPPPNESPEPQPNAEQLVGSEVYGHETTGAKRKVSLSLYPEFKYADTPAEGNKWGMIIDQNACIGCNACVMACTAENNVPVIGKDQVARGREMFWLRVDTYFAGSAEQPSGPYFQPLPCMHCEKAPCEVVCPVGATVHDAEGLNNMVYNRCVGTRYCSNNCPYKVRHFNFLHYTKPITEANPLSLMMNPNVTVRYRGVMEKCTYCVQRINAARQDAKVQFADGLRPTQAIRDGEVVTACAQACPTQAIVFGNLNDRDATVAKLAMEPGNYGLLEELQTQPRTTYLPRYYNPAPATDEGAFF